MGMHTWGAFVPGGLLRGAFDRLPVADDTVVGDYIMARGEPRILNKVRYNENVYLFEQD